MRNTGTQYMSDEHTPTVLPEMSELLPPLTDEQLSLLEADILKNGCYTPVIVNEELVVVDGHNRMNICQKHGLPYRMAVFSFEDLLEAKQWALDTQKSRRNLSINELCKIAMKLRPEIEAKAEKRKADNGGDKKSDVAKSEMTPVSSPILSEKSSVRKELAEAVGVGEVTMGRAMKIEDEAPKTIKDAVDSGDITIAQGYNLTRELEDMDIPEEDQEDAAREAVEREIARKNESKKRKIDEKTRIAKLFCAAFENSVLLKPTVENVEIWIERSGILYHQLGSMAKEAKQIAEKYLEIADIITNTIKPRDWRYKNGVEKDEQITQSREDGDIDDTEEETPDFLGTDA